MNSYPTDRGAFPPDRVKPDTHSGSSKATTRFVLPPYRVVLFQNATRSMMAIVHAVMELLRFCKTEATHKMWQAHYDGRATLIVTHRERAELFVELFASRGIDVGIEAV